MDEPTFNYDDEAPNEIIAEVWRARAESWAEFGTDWKAREAAVQEFAARLGITLPPPLTLDDPLHPLNVRRAREAAGIFWKPPGESA